MTINASGYSPEHPWYYLLGGPILRPKQILNMVKDSGDKGYIEIDKLDRKSEPQRSESLRSLRLKVVSELRNDLSKYRHFAFELKHYRITHPLQDKYISCDDIHTNICFKHNHIYNDFAHLIQIDKLLAKQLDLFAL